VRLLVGYDGGAVGPLEIVRSLSSLADVAFLVPASIRDSEIWPVLTGLADVVVLPAAGSLPELTGIDGVVTFSEKMLRPTAALSWALELPGHSPLTARLLTDKFAQRQALREVSAVRCVLIAGVEEAHPELLAQVGSPAVLKPVQGQGSRNTRLIVGYAQLRDQLQLVLGSAAGQPALESAVLLEEYLPGADRRPFADYVSVESVVQDGRIEHLAVTGKFPQLTGFREVGDFWPPALDESERWGVEALAEAALRALGVRCGITHTEVKLTPSGPRIIEVNGRLGGDVNALSLAAYGIDMTAVAARVALGLPVSLPPRQLSGVVYNVSAIAPATAGTLVSVTGAAQVRRDPAVAAYRRFVAPGSPIEPGTALDLVTGRADSHAELPDAVRSVLRNLSYEFGRADGSTFTVGGWDLTLNHAEHQPA
jgi:hypothetical protein